MTNEKARDFFSAYHEGTLEPGLTVSFEQKLKGDADLRREYDSFVKAMGELDLMKLEEIEIPNDLHERISARLDRHIYERKNAKAPIWSGWVRSLSFAGIAGVAIVGAVLGLSNRGSGPGPGAGVLNAGDQLNVNLVADGVNVSFSPSSEKTIMISNEGKVLNRTTVGEATSKDFKTLLSNPLPSASVFSVRVLGDINGTYIAMPGSVRSAVVKGDGTVVDLAKAVSDYYRMPVKLETRMPNERASWTFTTSDAVSESSKALPSNYAVTLGQKGMLEIDEK